MRCFRIAQTCPDEAVAVTVGQVAEALRSSKRGSAAGLSGATFEMYKFLLDDGVAIDLLTRHRQTPRAGGRSARGSRGSCDVPSHGAPETTRRSQGHSDRRCLPALGVSGAGAGLR